MKPIAFFVFWRFAKLFLLSDGNIFRTVQAGCHQKKTTLWPIWRLRFGDLALTTLSLVVSVTLQVRLGHVRLTQLTSCKVHILQSKLQKWSSFLESPHCPPSIILRLCQYLTALWSKPGRSLSLKIWTSWALAYGKYKFWPRASFELGLLTK